MRTTIDRAASHAEQGEDDSDYEQDDPEDPQDVNREHKPQHQQNDA